MKNRRSKSNTNETANLYISPNELARRWQCSRSSVDRIALRVGLRRLCLGTGRNGTIRYLLREIEAYEQTVTI